MFPALRLVQLSALVLLLSFAGPPTADADWRRVDSPNLVVIGDINEADLRDIAARLEGFRRTFGRMLDERSTATIVPTVVVALSSDRAFAPFAPKFDGRGALSRGLFLGTPDVNYIVVVNGPNGMRVVFHEYAHLMMSNVTRAAPLWLNEGLADYYSTFAAGNEGREVRLGRPIEAYVERLREATLLPLDQFLAVHSGSAIYNNGDQRTLFYAQAWALTHFLQLGEPDRTAQLASYLRRVASGVPEVQAWREAFGSTDIIQELHDYVLRERFRVVKYVFPDAVASVDPPAAFRASADAEVFLADLLIREQRYDAAAKWLARTARRQPGSAGLSAVSALLDIARKDYRSAERRLLTIGPTDDWLSAYVAGVGMSQLLDAWSGDARPDHLRSGERFFETVQKAHADLPNVRIRMAMLQLHGPDRPTVETRAAIERARTTAPTRADYAIVHARVLMRQSAFVAARVVLRTVMADGYPAHVRDAARTQADALAVLERAAPRSTSAKAAPTLNMATGLTVGPAARPEPAVAARGSVSPLMSCATIVAATGIEATAAPAMSCALLLLVAGPLSPAAEGGELYARGIAPILADGVATGVMTSPAVRRYLSRDDQ